MDDLPRLIAEWNAAEGRIATLALSRPDAYETYLRAVKVVADDLADVRSVEELADAFAEAPARADRVLAGAGFLPGEVRGAQVAGAAFAIRYRRLRSEERRAEAVARIREGGDRGDAWVTLYEEGVPGLPYPQPYRRIEMRVADGAGLHLFVEEDPGTGAPRYGIEFLSLDPDTGDPVDEPRDRRMFEDRGEWERTLEEARQAPGPP
jgi:hypothetical protein